MRLSLFTDYCLRVLTHVGTKDARGKDDLTTIDEICGAYGISRGHVMKVVYRLAQLGYLETVRGKGGGMRLARAPEKINLGAVVRDTEEDLFLVECFDKGAPPCAIEPACILKGALGSALKAFLAVLDGYTLADLLAPQKRLARLLGV